MLPPDALLPNPLPAWAESSEADTSSPTVHAAVSVKTRAVFFNDPRIEQERHWYLLFVKDLGAKLMIPGGSSGSLPCRVWP
ncbi:hypothetical protein [Bradyrhizobium sp. URHD0069]|uniref:hypothetical protein n=1 Tax=Bradyrhizobium sp. URHD0069 TaxID=1380355 RepID=UPI0012DFADCD|nr:hypothetical protein [Bradyrhizobium sp. URHD0069]